MYPPVVINNGASAWLEYFHVPLLSPAPTKSFPPLSPPLDLVHVLSLVNLVMFMSWVNVNSFRLDPVSQ